MAQVRNTKTGQTLTIPDDQVRFMTNQWEVVKDQPVQQNVNQTKQPDATNTTVYFKDGTTMVVPAFDVAYWQRQGWSTTKPDTTKPDTSKDEVDPGLNNPTNPNAMDSNEKQVIDKLNADIDAMSGLSYEQKIVLKQIAQGNYTSGAKIPSIEELSRIIQDAATNAEADLSPYYTKMTGRELEDLKNSMSSIRDEAARYGQREAVSYSQKLESTKQSLRQRGLTFSGISRQKLGNESVIGGDGIKGDLQTEREMDYKDKVAGWKSDAQKIGLASERLLGSSTINSLDLGSITTPFETSKLYNTAGTTSTGDLELDKIKAIEKSKWERINASRLNI